MTNDATEKICPNWNPKKFILWKKIMFSLKQMHVYVDVFIHKIY